MEYTLIRARKRTLSLQVNRSGEVIARAPLYMPKFLIDQFVRDKSDWISKRIREAKKPSAKHHAHFSEDKLKAFIKLKVRSYAKIMSVEPSGLRFTRVKSYWGTCAPSGVLSFNLALRYTPPKAVAYVVVHELAHLRWKGHGKRFWDVVIKYYPETKAMRSVLRKIPRSSI